MNTRCVDLGVLDTGTGDPVVLVMGTGATGRVWHTYQVPALVGAGHRAITFDNRGIRPGFEPGFTVADLVADLAGLIDRLGVGPCALVGTSLGAYVVQELLLVRPDLATAAVLMATKGRPDVLRTRLAQAEKVLFDSGTRLPPEYAAVVHAMHHLSPHTLDRDAADWLDLLELSARTDAGVRAQLDLEPGPDRLADYRHITTACHVVAFADDLITPPHLGREVADAIPGATFEVIGNCGHYGYLEDPAAVNASLLAFLDRDRYRGGTERDH